MILEKKKDVRATFISLVAVALFLALVLVLDQVIKPSNKMYMLLTVLPLLQFCAKAFGDYAAESEVMDILRWGDVGT